MASKNYQILLESINKQRNPEALAQDRLFSIELGEIPYKYAMQFIRTAMQPVESTYTDSIVDVGNKIKSTLHENLDRNKHGDVNFDFQGSVRTNTHIKGHSDIDLLTFSNKFYSYNDENLRKVISENHVTRKFSESEIHKIKNIIESKNYDLNTLEELKSLRIDCELILQKKYIVTNISKPKSIQVEYQNPKRKVDISVANWFHDTEYIISEEGINKGVQIYIKMHYDEKNGALIQHKKDKVDYPFLSISRINEKDKLVNDRLKKMIRFCKTIKGEYEKATNEKLSLNSFIFNAMFYDIDPNSYSNCKYYELVEVIYLQVLKLNNQANYRFNLKSVDGREYVFRNDDQQTENTQRVAEMKIIETEIQAILNDSKIEMR